MHSNKTNTVMLFEKTIFTETLEKGDKDLIKYIYCDFENIFLYDILQKNEFC